MARYRMLDGTVIDTAKAKNHWEDGIEYSTGGQQVSRATRTEHERQTLYMSRKGRYYIEHTTRWQGRQSHCEWVSPQEATRWLLHNEYEAEEMPADLAALVEDVIE